MGTFDVNVARVRGRGGGKDANSGSPQRDGASALRQTLPKPGQILEFPAFSSPGFPGIGESPCPARNWPQWDLRESKAFKPVTILPANHKQSGGEI